MLCLYMTNKVQLSLILFSFYFSDMHFFYFCSYSYVTPNMANVGLLHNALFK